MVILEHDSAQQPPSHQEVLDTSTMRAKDMQKLVKTVVGKLPEGKWQGLPPVIEFRGTNLTGGVIYRYKMF